MSTTLSFYEFFAGGGMVRAGLGSKWECLFANDFDHKKGRIYRENWGGDELKTADVGTLTTSDIPMTASLAWASFPCQDLSLAGGGAGLKGDRSGTFRPFWKLMKGLIDEGRAPSMIVLENVCGTLNSHGGKDFATICSGFEEAGYWVGAVVLDAVHFVPQSRPRLFVIGVRGDVEIPQRLHARGPMAPWHTRSLLMAYGKLPQAAKDRWIWWKLPMPSVRRTSLADVVEEEPNGVPWFSPEETLRLLGMMSVINQNKVEEAMRQCRRMVGGVYKRTRANEKGLKVQRAEIRFDDVSGCLRTPAGGSSRQVIVIVDGKSVAARLISSRETARLMGLPDSYILPENYNEAYHLTGDGVVVPVIRHLAKHIFEPVLEAIEAQTAAA
ncbi:MAG: DNA (cytosine-5-)-methyltransferase [Bryobacteraceae bacterium]|jgi:DNA (cytosine-5)-methyltransferase 1